MPDDLIPRLVATAIAGCGHMLTYATRPVGRDAICRKCVEKLARDVETRMDEELDDMADERDKLKAALRRIGDLHSGEMGDPDTHDQVVAALAGERPPWTNRWEYQVAVLKDFVAAHDAWTKADQKWRDNNEVHGPVDEWDALVEARERLG